MFPIQVTFTISNPETLERLAALLSVREGNAVGHAVVTAEAQGEAVVGAAPAPKETKTTVEEITYDAHIVPAIVAYARKNGRDKTEELLKAFGAVKGTDLKPAQYPEFLKTVAH